MELDKQTNGKKNKIKEENAMGEKYVTEICGHGCTLGLRGQEGTPGVSGAWKVPSPSLQEAPSSVHRPRGAGLR